MRRRLIQATVCTLIYVAMAACATTSPAVALPPSDDFVRTTPAAPSEYAEVQFAGDTPHGYVEFIDDRPSAVAARPLFRSAAGVIELADPQLENQGWVQVHIAPDGDLIGVLDSAVEGPAWELQIVRSGDGGRTWELASTLSKPYYMAQVDALTAAPPEGVCITLLLEDDYGSGVTPGRYVACSGDGGRSWTPLKPAC